MIKRFLTVFTTIALTVAWVRAQAPEPALAEKERWTVDDIVQCERAADFQMSPDCHWVVWTKNVPDKEKGEFVSRLVRASLAEKQEVELTRGTESCTDPKWSPDGRHIAFLTSRPHPKSKPQPEGGSKPSHDEEKEKPQLWLIHPFGGEAWPLTELDRGVAKYEWADAETILFTAQEAPSLQETTTKEEKKIPPRSSRMKPMRHRFACSRYPSRARKRRALPTTRIASSRWRRHPMAATRSPSMSAVCASSMTTVLNRLSSFTTCAAANRSRFWTTRS
jgi:hypothetical protein